MPSHVDEQTLSAAVGRHLGQPVTIEDLRRLSGGASRETWSFDAVTAGAARHALVLRRDPAPSVGLSDRSVEFSLLDAAHDAGVATPRVWFLLEADDGLGSGFVMERIEGETIPRRILRDDAYAAARPMLARQCGEQAALIHTLDPPRLPALAVQGAREQIALYRGYLDGFGEPHPAFELGLRWLAEHAPPDPPRPALVHGDFRNGNFVVGPDGIRAVLDWELAHLGDPVEDLGWLCVKWAGGGRDVDPAELGYWEAMGTLKWGVICEIQAFTHLQGTVRSVELATLGRRVAEMEWDLLELVDRSGDG